MAIVRNVLLTLTILVMVGNSLGDHDSSWSFWRWLFRPWIFRPTRPPRPPAAGRCRTGNDCGRNECCLAPGVCRPLGGVAARCDTRQPYQWKKPIAMVRGFPMCPCRTGNLCAPVRRGTTRGICSFGK